MLGPDTGTLGHGVATTSHQPGYSQELKAEQVIFSRPSAAQQIQPQLGMGLLIFNTSLLSHSSSDCLLAQSYWHQQRVSSCVSMFQKKCGRASELLVS